MQLETSHNPIEVQLGALFAELSHLVARGYETVVAESAARRRRPGR